MFKLVSSVCTQLPRLSVTTTIPKRSIFSSTKVTRGLEEFFTGYDNYKVGRSWSAAQLRLKSTEDLEKLHYVCLKELNMLMTYKHFISRTPNVSMIAPERVSKVKKTMQLIQHVIHERTLAMGYMNSKPGFIAKRQEINYLRKLEKERDAKNAEKAKSVFSVNINDKTARRKAIGSKLKPRTTL